MSFEEQQWPIEPPRSSVNWWPIVGACLYGFLMRFLFRDDNGFLMGFLFRDDNGFRVMTVSFLLFVPVAMGALAVYLRNRPPHLSIGQMFLGTWPMCALFLVGLMIAAVEGSICVVMAAPIFFMGTGIGGVVVGLCQRWLHAGKNTMMGLAVLPLLASPVEQHVVHFAQVNYAVQDEIIIHAPANEVWQKIGQVERIAPDEWHSGIGAILGVPRPLRADMSQTGVGAVRTSLWEKDVVFQEKITQWDENRSMTYDFIIDPNQIPPDALDEHVRMGGEYFGPLHGGYTLQALPDGSTKLTLRTVVRDSTHFGWYSQAWGQAVFHDFHQGVLRVIKNRSEAAI
ncbi:MAG: hypothetical protein ACRCV6_03600 [Formosimonas sp.]